MPRALDVLLVASTACLGSAAADPSTGVSVMVRRGPIAPVEQVGVDNTAPVAGAEVLVLNALLEALGRGTTDTAGRVSLPVPPGDYRVVVASCPGALRAPEPEPVKVVVGALTPARLVCDTGIR